MHGLKTESLLKLSYANLTVLGCCVSLICPVSLFLKLSLDLEQGEWDGLS